VQGCPLNNLLRKIFPRTKGRQARSVNAVLYDATRLPRITHKIIPLDPSLENETLLPRHRIQAISPLIRLRLHSG
ncbi:hypothetical protein, partial [Paenibacillus alkalitolerans]|uniref:hypothetical protein n=1 Tax=Paenibacillus alkalitolerans TaxID=2799335 RepID=UPI001F36B8FC